MRSELVWTLWRYPVLPKQKKKSLLCLLLCANWLPKIEFPAALRPDLPGMFAATKAGNPGAERCYGKSHHGCGSCPNGPGKPMDFNSFLMFDVFCWNPSEHLMGFNPSPSDTWEILGILEEDMWCYCFTQPPYSASWKNMRITIRREAMITIMIFWVSTIMILILLSCDDSIDDDNSDNYDMTYTSIYMIMQWRCKLM